MTEYESEQSARGRPSDRLYVAESRSVALRMGSRSMSRTFESPIKVSEFTMSKFWVKAVEANLSSSVCSVPGCLLSE